MHAFLKHLSSRRLFLMRSTKSMLALAGLSTLSGFSSAANASSPSSEHALHTLARLVEDLFPHKDLSKQVYMDTGKIILGNLSQSSKEKQLLQDGIKQLDGMAAGPGWIELPDAERLSALEKIQGNDFFSAVINTARESIYRDPRVWDRLGYGGNALQQGGYLQRGFDDIDWLPE